MKKKITIKNFFLLLIITSLLVWLFLLIKRNNTSLINLPDHSVIKYQIAGKTIKVEVVNKADSISRGLGGRENLNVDGMLFVFPSPVTTSFWMKDMLFPIDLYWIANEQIVGVEKNMLPPNDLNSQETMKVYYSPGMVDMVLEIPTNKDILLP
ncbi:MAG: hypothetical protein COU63_03780 [Candidatus Pacebacteria bacterium CG10_big_fil_rev_8_21_14_0_10_36_11]|nr:DUF192 domain-containing protein [Candidatus Pacearchaeota archaeon]OIP73855.1 MAG: hypothetical protein AUK08_04850 [Candidatus Pacebacteria bacterium CG2_30_36_39]PIR64582.1 MAG: hypothetical protein COU63_03780 [Candidatus Pacebacteria bacterium CG10_big_fil_rev_8_21_14_0_10_36_11]PJC43005.1 MAG: hypothetical protein CO040_01540 [Candidatus Pacebacteria bacterium CG_4_9_14_0_2_um_filter_36_8]